MSCVHKEYEVEIKMVMEQWLQLKVKFLLGYDMRIFIYWVELTFDLRESNKNLVGESAGGIFPGRVEWANFWLVSGGLPPSP